MPHELKSFCRAKHHKSKLTKFSRNAILKPDIQNNGGAAVQTVGYIDREIYSCITKNITTDEVIITPERIQHIRERRGEDFLEKYEPQIASASCEKRLTLLDISIIITIGYERTLR